MKRNSKKAVLAIAAAAAAAGFGISRTAHADLVAGWNFNTDGTTVAHGSGTLSLSAFDPAFVVTTFAGTIVNAVSPDVAGNALAIQGGTGGTENNGKALVFNLNLTGYNAPVITFASQATATGFGTNVWEYSTDGVSYTPFQTFVRGTTAGTLTTSFTTTGVLTVDMSSVTALRNLSSVYIEDVISGATNSSGNQRFDNVQFNSTVFAAVGRNLTWDNSTAAGIQEGPGSGPATWSTSSNTWTADGGSTNVTWNNSPADVATFGSASGTGLPGAINLGSAITAASITFAKSGYSITDSGNLGLTINTGAVTVSGLATDTATISAAIAGSNGLAKSGSGILLLTSTANTYTSGTTLNGGTLSISDDKNLGDVSGNLTLTSGTLQVTGSTFTTARAVSIGAAGVILNIPTGPATFGGAITDTAAGTLTKSGSGSLVLTGAAGGAAAPVPLILSGGSVVIASTTGSQNFSSTGANTLNGNVVITTPVRVNFDGGTFSGSGTIQTTVSNAAISASGSLANLNVLVNNNIALNSGNVAGPFVTHLGVATATNTLNLNGTISGNSDVDFASDNSVVSGSGTGNGAGVLVLGAANSWTGSTTVNTAATGGVVRLGVDNALPTGTALQFASTGTAYSVGAVDLNGHNQTIGSLASGTTNTIIGIVNTGASLSTLTINGSAATTYSGNIGIPSNLTNLTGANNNIALVLASGNTGSLVLTGANAYTGGTTVSGGTLLASNKSGSATGSGAVQVNSSGTIGGNGTIGGSVTVASGGKVSPGVAGVGTLHATGLSLAAGSGLNYDFSTPSNSDKILVNNTGSTLTVNGGAFTLAGNVVDPGTFPLVEYAGTLGGAGFGALSISNPNAFIGFTVSLEHNATGKIVNAVVMSNAPAVTWSGNLTSWDKTTPNWHGVSTTYVDGDQVIFDDSATNKNIVVNDNVGPQTITFQDNTDYTLSQGTGTITDNGNIGEIGIVKRGSGKLTISGNYSFTGAVAVDEGTVSVATIGTQGNPGPLGAGSEIRIGAGTLSYSGTGEATDRTISLATSHANIDVVNSGAVLELDGSVTGGGGLNINTQGGAGTVLLNAAASYLGTTHVAAGFLSDNNGIPDTSDVTIDAPGTLMLTGSDTVGSIAGAGTIAGSGNSLTVGGSNADATFSGNLTAGNFTKTGTGTQVLTGTSSIGGQILVNGGTLAVNGSGLGTPGGGVAIDNGATLSIISSFTTSTNIAINTGTGKISTAPGAVLTLTGQIQQGSIPAGALTFTGSGTVNLTNPSSGFTNAVNVTGGTMEVSAVDSLGIGGNGTGTLTVSGTGVYQIANVKVGLTSGLSNGTLINLNLNNGGTIMGTGSNAAFVDGSNTQTSVGTGATVYITTGSSTSDVFMMGGAIKTQTTDDTTNKIIVNDPTSGNGKGTVILGNGGVSSTGYFAGSWELRGGILQIGPTPNPGVSFGEPLNALGFSTGNGSGPTSPITLTGGVLALAVNGPNTVNSPALAATTFRSPVTFSGGAIASTNGIDGSFSGNLTTSPATISRILTYDPSSTSTVRNVNLLSQATISPSAPVPGNFTWANSSTLIVDPGTTSGGLVDFNRTATGSTVTVGTNATLQINNNATVQFDGTQDSLSDGTHFVNVVNNSTTGSNGGLNVASSTAKNVGVLSGIGSTTVQSGGQLIATSITQNALTLHGNAKVRASSSGQTVSRIPQSGLTIDSGKQLDLTNNKLIVSNGTLGTLTGTTYSGITGVVQAGRSGGTWTGSGIITSQAQAGASSVPLTTLAVAANADLKKTTFGGQAVSSTDVLVMYTYAGDANLDGKIDADDYFQIDSNYNKSGASTSSYYKGDFNYDGKVNGDDYFIIDSNFTHQTLGVFPPAAPLADGAALSGVAAVPEPTSLGLLGLSAAGLFGRRKRRQVAPSINPAN